MPAEYLKPELVFGCGCDNVRYSTIGWLASNNYLFLPRVSLRRFRFHFHKAICHHHNKVLLGFAVLWSWNWYPLSSLNILLDKKIHLNAQSDDLDLDLFLFFFGSQKDDLDRDRFLFNFSF